MRKAIGYILKTISVFLFFVLFLGFFKNIFSQQAINQGVPYFIGFLIGSILGTIFFLVLNYFLFRLSNKLIREDFKNKN